MCFVLSKSLHNLTKTSPKHIMPQKAHVDMAQIQAAKGSLRLSEAWSDWSMFMVIGGHIGHLWLPWIFSRPHNDQLMCLWSSSVRGGGHPWVICQAQIADKYFLATPMDTGLKGIPIEVSGPNMSESDTVHRVKECRSRKDAEQCLKLDKKWSWAMVCQPLHLPFCVISEALFCICAHQYVQF